MNSARSVLSRCGGCVTLMMKRLVLPVCLILVGLIAAAFGVLHASKTISEPEAAKIASEYAKTKLASYEQNNGVIRKMVLTSDLVSLVTGSQEWIVDMDDMYAWITINAYTGKVESTQTGFTEWIAPNDTPPISRYTSLFMLVPYAMMIGCSFGYWKKTLWQVLFWLSFSLFIVALITFKLLAVLIIIGMGM
jgi:hypothetical protein